MSTFRERIQYILLRAKKSGLSEFDTSMLLLVNLEYRENISLVGNGWFDDDKDVYNVLAAENESGLEKYQTILKEILND